MNSHLTSDIIHNYQSVRLCSHSGLLTIFQIPTWRKRRGRPKQMIPSDLQEISQLIWSNYLQLVTHISTYLHLYRAVSQNLQRHKSTIVSGFARLRLRSLSRKRPCERFTVTQIFLWKPAIHQEDIQLLRLIPYHVTLNNLIWTVN